MTASTEPQQGNSRAQVNALPGRPEDRICEAIGAAVSEAIATGQFAEHLAVQGWHLVHTGPQPPEPPTEWLHDGIDITEPGWIDVIGRLGELWRTAWTAGHRAGQIRHPD